MKKDVGSTGRSRGSPICTPPTEQGTPRRRASRRSQASGDTWTKQYAKPGFSIYARGDGAEIYGGGHVWVTTQPGPTFHRSLKAAKAYTRPYRRKSANAGDMR